MYGMEEKFETPKELRQIGGIDEKLKLYVEDYAYSYLEEYVGTVKNMDKYCILVGKEFKHNNKKVVVINGVIKSKIKTDDILSRLMDEKIRLDLENEIRNNFYGNKMIGWVHLTNRELDNAFKEDYDYHRLNFYEDNSILIIKNINDNEEKVFYKSDNDVKDVNGYFIFYKDNKQMLNYIERNPISNKVYKKQNQLEKEDNNDKKVKITSCFEGDNKISNKFAIFTATLMIMCVLMGLGLIKSLDRINKMEDELSKVDNKYINLENKLNTIRDNTSIPVMNLDDVYKFEDDRSKYTYHKVRKGESLNLISERYYNSKKGVSKILAANEIEDVNKIYEGQDLIIPLD